MPAIAPLILLAEDDRYIRETTSDLLALSGIRVVAVPNGRDASAVLEREPIDLLITDLVMPDGDGLWLLSQLGQFNARARSGRIPVIVLTAHADTTERAAEARARADDYLSKPFEPDHLIATVRRWLAAGRTGAPACP